MDMRCPQCKNYPDSPAHVFGCEASMGTPEPADPYVEEADANSERRNNGCQIYRVGP